MLINESIKNGSIRTQIPAPFGLAGFNDFSLSSHHCQAVAGREESGQHRQRFFVA